MLSTLIDIVLIVAVFASVIVSVFCYRRMRQFKETVEAFGPAIREFVEAIDTSKEAVSELREGAERFTHDVEQRVRQEKHREHAMDSIPKSRPRVANPTARPDSEDRKTSVINDFYAVGATR